MPNLRNNWIFLPKYFRIDEISCHDGVDSAQIEVVYLYLK
jgi:hypothetical protein